VALLFDASAIMNLILKRGHDALASARGNYALDLTGYETGNAVWRLSSLEEKITIEEAHEFLSSVVDFLGLLRTIKFEELDCDRVLDVATQQRLTFYDAAYLVAAESKNLTLTTDDEALGKAAQKYVASKESTET
jgi:predicted nucleic acid-binding protein